MGPVSTRIENLRRERGVLLMGVLNVTPDSFFDGGRYDNAENATQRIDQLLAGGADLIDIGAESTRPGAAAIPASEQMARLEPALSYASARGALISVDTASAVVARHALARGAHLVNDVSCLADEDLARACAEHGAPLIIMHARGPAASMAGFSVYPDAGYQNVVEDVRREWRAARARALAVGMSAEDIYFDPGLGFAKNAQQSYTLLARLAEFQSEGLMVVGASRKSFLASVDGAPPSERLGGSVAACLLAAARGAAILRVHDVREVAQALRVAAVVERASQLGRESQLATEAAHAG
ncbi:MAG TPA: dihydropteroate synthase [Polyangiaceae bacterium]|nr:dihydropteroate synthase [Polyangiaceae bacterium]